MDASLNNIFQDQFGNILKVTAVSSEEKNGIPITVTTFTVVDREKYPLPDGWQARPVMLTDEILRKCGFIPCGIMDDEFNHGKNYRFKLRRMTDGTYQFVAHRPVYLKHLHRLQNLFFELEEEALEINL